MSNILPECCRSKLVSNPRVKVVHVLVRVPLGQRPESKCSHKVVAQYDREPLLVDNVLILSGDNATRLLVQLFIVPAGIELA